MSAPEPPPLVPPPPSVDRLDQLPTVEAARRYWELMQVQSEPGSPAGRTADVLRGIYAEALESLRVNERPAEASAPALRRATSGLARRPKRR